MPADDLVQWGTALADQSSSGLTSERSRRLADACAANSAFEVQELREIARPTIGRCEVIVVRCTNQAVPNRNPVGIRVREILALTIPVDERYPPDVRALRRDFPVVPHLNSISQGEPRSLCVFVDAWSAARRTWTPQRYLTTILWWLKETANGTLHLPDQPLERVYFNNFGGELVLPAGYTGDEPENARLVITGVMRPTRFTFVAVDASDAAPDRREYVPICLRVERVHGTTDSSPATLGELADQWTAWGFPIAQMLVEKLRTVAGGGKIDVPGQHVMLILDIGVKRSAEGAVERREFTAFLVQRSAASLGDAMGAVYRHNFMYFAPSDPNPTAAEEHANEWRSTVAMPLEVRIGLTRADAREQAGVGHEGGDAARVLLGVGALGSALAEIWAREGWGRWTYVDPDHIQPHNLVRHRALYRDVGRFKAHAVKDITDGVFDVKDDDAVALPTTATGSDDALNAALASAALVIDVTTTLDVPRELSRRAETRRMASAFMTPSGQSCVLLMEDGPRETTLDCLEAQYYRQILREPWGALHLQGNAGHVAVGAGCRDVSVIMSPERVELHAAILARQIRARSVSDEASLNIWVAADDGSVIAHTARVRRAYRLTSSTWNVVIDDEVLERMHRYREMRLPKETGGVVLGYSDHVSRTIYVVDVMAAPSDSMEAETAFVRGSNGLPAAWKDAQERTASIVNYVGEWHSHPPKHGAAPSWDDMKLVAELGDILARDGDPVLMFIMAENEFGAFVCASDGTTARISAAALRRATSSSLQ